MPTRGPFDRAEACGSALNGAEPSSGQAYATLNTTIADANYTPAAVPAVVRGRHDHRTAEGPAATVPSSVSSASERAPMHDRRHPGHAGAAGSSGQSARSAHIEQLNQSMSASPVFPRPTPVGVRPICRCSSSCRRCRASRPSWLPIRGYRAAGDQVLLGDGG